MSVDRNIHIPIGSGYLYFSEYSGTIPADNTIEVDANRLGYIEGGAELVYTPTRQVLKDDYGLVQRNVLTAEEAALNCELIAWSKHDMDVFASTATVDETTTSGHRIIKIGGIENDNGKKYVFRFVHPDETYGDLRVTIVGTQNAGFTLAFRPTEAGKMALSITAAPHDDDGTLITIDEELPA